MFCSYENITDYCTNKYSYQYYDVTQSSPVAFATSGDNQSAVIRTDNDTGQQIILTPNSNGILQSCDANDDAIEAVTDWECYQIFLLTPNASVAPANISVVQKKQIETNEVFFSDSLNDGLVINLDGYNPITLKTSIIDQIHYGNIGMLANMLYTENTDNPMPAILDINNVSYSLDYNTLNNILIKYFNAVANKKYIKDNNLTKLQQNNLNIDDINQYYFCVGKIPDSYSAPTTISEIIIKEPPLLPPGGGGDGGGDGGGGDGGGGDCVPVCECIFTYPVADCDVDCPTGTISIDDVGICYCTTKSTISPSELESLYASDAWQIACALYCESQQASTYNTIACE